MYSHLQGDVVGPPGAAAEAIAPAVVRPTPVSSLLDEIARAMQAAADRERERIDASVAEEEAAQVEKIHARAAAESTALRKGADDDVDLVNAWCEEQIRRIRAKADRRIEDRRRRLEQSVMHHGSLIEAEMQSVHVAVQGYRDSLGTFFGRLAEERDPSEIARLAGTLPDPPDFDAARADARSRAMKAFEEESAAETPAPTDEGPTDGNGSSGPERELVPVMDPAVDEQHAATAGGAANPLAIPVSSAPSAEAPAAPSQPDADATLARSVVLASHGNVAVRVIRTFTGWGSPTSAPEDR